MARRGTGRWVERAAATGGGRTYRGQRPIRWYMSLVLICLVGVGLVAYSRYERQHPAAGPQPVYAALAVDICGQVQSNLPAPNTKTTPGVTTEGDGVIRVSKAEVGAHATLEQFVKSYPGLTLTSTSLKLPGKSTHRNGDTCPAGTPDAHKRADVRMVMWASATGTASNTPITVGDPSALTLANGQLITIAFAPSGASLPKPSPTSISAMQTLISGVSSTTTTAPSSSTTTPSSSTTAPSSSTTAPTTTTTTTPSSTTTTS